MNGVKRWMSLSLLMMVIALFLPSYTYIPPGGREGTIQRGLDSLISPPIGAATLVNFLYWVLLVLISRNASRGARAVIATPMLVFLLLCGFGFMLGDPQPGSHSHIGIGATMWVLSIAMLGIAGISKVPNPGSGTSDLAD